MRTLGPRADIEDGLIPVQSRPFATGASTLTAKTLGTPGSNAAIPR